MSNHFYNYSGAFLPGILARAEAEQAEFTLVQAGFALLDYQGTDSGSANTYVITTQGAPNGASYADGQIVEFKAGASNTGLSTINVNGIGVVNLQDFQGVTLASGAIKANTWVRCVYNSSFSAFTLIAPTSQVITSNTISAAAPTNKVGLTAAGGVSTACVPIDATYALDVGIAPTWTGAHTFSNSVTFASTVSFSGGLALTGNANQYAATLTGNSTAGQSLGLRVNAGTNASDFALRISNQSAGTDYFEVLGEGSIVAGNPTGGGKGVGTINAQNLYVQGTAVLTSSAGAANPGTNIGLSVVNGTATTFMRSDGAPALSQAIVPTWTGVHVFSGTSTTAVTVNPAANQQGIHITGGTNTSLNYLAEFISAQASGFSGGLHIKAGTTSGDAAVAIDNAAGSLSMFYMYGDGEFMITAPTASTNQTTDFSQVGYMDAPQNLQNGSTYTFAFKDRGKSVSKSGGAAATWTIPVNGTTAFPIGTTILLVGVNNVVNNVTLSIAGTGTLNWAPTGSTGSRTLTGPWLATLYKQGTDTWIVAGAGIS